MFERSQLAKLWIAQGLIKNGDSKPLREVENECVDGLLHRSLLEQHKDHLGITKYLMHDIMHDLAQHILEEEQSLTSEGVTHSNVNNEELCAYNISNFIEPIAGRTLHSSLYSKPIEVKSNTLDLYLKRLRVMMCEASYFDTISNSIGQFKHLRYLSLFGKISSLPKVICLLYNLHTLNLKIMSLYYQYFEFPEDIRNLKKLQHIYVSPRMKLTKGIGELVHLQTLAKTVEILRYGKYCTISELENLSSLGGTIDIEGLETVETIEEASSAKLDLKKNIKSLKYGWNGRRVFNKNVI